MTTIIPPMAHPLSSGWDQPPVEDIWFLDDLAVMAPRTFDDLADYSRSTPSGVYDGKMWRSQFGKDWFLRWFAPSDVPDTCLVMIRRIAVVALPETAAEGLARAKEAARRAAWQASLARNNP